MSDEIQAQNYALQSFSQPCDPCPGIFRDLSAPIQQSDPKRMPLQKVYGAYKESEGLPMCSNVKSQGTTFVPVLEPSLGGLTAKLCYIPKKILSGPSRQCILLLMCVVVIGGSLTFVFIPRDDPEVEILDIRAPMSQDLPIQTFNVHLNTVEEKKLKIMSTSPVSTNHNENEGTEIDLPVIDPVQISWDNPPHCEHKVSSVSDLENFGSLCDTVIVSSLTEDFASASRVKMINSNGVLNLKIIGPISPPWLSIILKQFSNIKILSINVKKLCEGIIDLDPSRNSSLGVPFTLENVQSLYIENSNSKCEFGVMTRIFGWRMPNIRILNIERCSLTMEAFQPFHKFMASHNDSLSVISINKSYLCEDCMYTDVDFKGLEKFELLDQMDTPLYDNADND